MNCSDGKDMSADMELSLRLLIFRCKLQPAVSMARVTNKVSFFMSKLFSHCRLGRLVSVNDDKPVGQDFPYGFLVSVSSVKLLGPQSA